MKVNLVERRDRTPVLVGPTAVGLLGVLVAVAIVGLIGIGIGSYAGPPIAMGGALIAAFALTLE
ncbi:hypothetical protein [Halalkalicoccus tibetensis]|uniref:Uncharacterized protein n=1 Tax=Halalkalicoccus tibetensis TaxID=175632 RepID=A0ABD5UWX4_9EURY